MCPSGTPRRFSLIRGTETYAFTFRLMGIYVSPCARPWTGLGSDHGGTTHNSMSACDLGLIKSECMNRGDHDEWGALHACNALDACWSGPTCNDYCRQTVVGQYMAVRLALGPAFKLSHVCSTQAISIMLIIVC